MIKKIIALILVPIVFMLTGELISIKDTGIVSFNIETNNTITTDTYNSLLAYKDFKDFTLKRSLNITNDDIEKSRLKINDEVKNEITNNELIENVSLIDLNNIEKISNNDKHFFHNFISSHNIKQLNQVYTDLNLLENVNTLNIIGEKLADVTIYGKSSVKVKQSDIDIANLKVNDTIKNELIYTNGQATISEKVGKKLIVESDIFPSIDTSRVNLDYVYLAKPLDFAGRGNVSYTYRFTLEGFSSLDTNPTIDNAINIGKIYPISNTNFYVGFPKGITIQEVKTQLIGKTITYQLAVQNPKEKILQDSDIASIFTGASNFDFALVNKPLDYISYNSLSYISNSFLLDNFTIINGASSNFTDINQVSSNGNQLYIMFSINKGTTLTQARDLLRNKKLTYQLTTPRYALTEGIQDIINPKVKSTSQDGKTTEIQFNETLASIPNTSISDEIKPLTNGHFEVTKKVKTVKLWEYSNITLASTLSNTYQFSLVNFKSTNSLKSLIGSFINTINYVNGSDDNRHWRGNAEDTNLNIYIEKPLIDTQTGTTLTDKLKTYLQTNNITFKGEQSTYEKYITTPTGNSLLELYPSGTVYTDSPIKLNYTDYIKPNSTINGNYSLFKNHLYYTGELQAGLFEINQTTKPVNTYEITNSIIKYDVITKKITLDINDSYNSIEISPNDNFKDLSGYELINNNYELTYYIYQIQDPYIREFIKIVPMIYIGVVLIYILMFKERG